MSSKTPMNLTWRGQNCFEIGGKNITLVVDPYEFKAVGLKNIRPAADVVLFSASDPTIDREIVRNTKLTIDSPGEYEVGGTTILGLPSFRDKQKGEKLGVNNIFIIEIDGINIVHLGHLGHALDERTIEQISAADILLVPVGGGDTIGAKEAVELASEIEPKIVIPMRYQIPGLKLKLQSVEVFKKEMGSSKPEVLDRLALRPKELPATETKLIILNPV